MSENDSTVGPGGEGLRARLHRETPEFETTATTPETQPSIQPKDGDVFQFTYSQESWESARRGIGHGDLRWCFDGQLVFRDGLLCDTYWGLNWRGDNGRYFQVGEAQAKGTLEYVCNLNEVEKIPHYDYELYADGDAFNLSHQHGCDRYYVKRRGARKDAARMIAAVHKKVEDARHEVERAVRNLEYAVQHRENVIPRIEAGEEPSI
jgi:hypothetical protein